MSWKITFIYNNEGYGDIVVDSEQDEGIRFRARTGSINKEGQLVNPCPLGQFFITELSKATDEEGMVVNGFGRKSRLYLKDESGNYIFTHYLFHPDGGKGGTRGCIAPLNHYEMFFKFIDRIVEQQTVIPVTVSRNV